MRKRNFVILTPMINKKTDEFFTVVDENGTEISRAPRSLCRLVYSFTGTSEEMPDINKDEIDEGRFWQMQKVIDKLGRDIFTPNFEHELKMLFIISSGTINIPD
jgi:hypothetical protein